MPNPTWSPNTPVAPGKVIIDANGNVQQAGNMVIGNTGAIPPMWGNVLGAVTPDGAINWVCVVVLQVVSLPTGIASLPIPTFVGDADELNPTAVLNDMIASFQNLTGRTLYPAQVERLLIDLYAYRESLVRNAIQYAALQCMLAFSSYPMIDYLGQLVGVARLPAQGASCTLQFTLAAAQVNPFDIPAGTLIGTQDGAFAFATQADLSIPVGATSGTVFATCTTPGATISYFNIPGAPPATNTPDIGIGLSAANPSGLPNLTQTTGVFFLNLFNVNGPIPGFNWIALGY